MSSCVGIYGLMGVSVFEWIFLFFFTKKRVRVSKESESVCRRVLKYICMVLLTILVVAFAILAIRRAETTTLFLLSGATLMVTMWLVTAVSLSYPDNIQPPKEKH